MYQYESDTSTCVRYIGAYVWNLGSELQVSGASAEFSWPTLGGWFFVPLRVFASPAFACAKVPAHHGLLS